MFSIGGNYRIELLLGVSQIFIPSLLLGRGFVWAFPYSIGLLQIPLYLAASIAIIIFRIQYDRFYQRRDSAQRGAVLAPEIKGRWPGNLDILLKYAVATLGASSL
jgi:hypothetical protein